VSALLETSAPPGAVEPEQLIAAALWFFAQCEEEVKHRVVRDFWFNDRGAQRWHTVRLQRSVATVVGRGGVKPFSNSQTLVAVLDWFARFPPDARAVMVGDHLRQLASSTAPVSRDW
jgi:hypothetical protein